MSPDPRWAHIGELFDGALARPREERGEWLAHACPDDEAIREEVLRLLDAHQHSSGILDGPAPADVTGAPRDLAARVRELLADRYVIERELGRGGMATVYLAHERKHARPVVLKFLNPEIAALWSTDRFEREVQIAARLSHPHILGLIDSGEVDGLLYYVMPFVDGETIGDRIARVGPLPLAEAMVFLRDVAEALAYAHRMGVVHRDLKPANIYCSGRHVFLMDFGIAKLLNPTPGQGSLTQLGAVIGTPAYMAPEQLGADPGIDHRVDLYAWGLLAFEMLTGELPARELLQSGAGALLAVRRGDVPPVVADLVTQCLEPVPENRLDDAETIVDAMAGLVAPSSQSLPRFGSRSRRVALIVGGVVAAAAIAGGFAIVGRQVGGGDARTGIAQPIGVVSLVNETGDPSLDTWGRMAGDWITQGLQQTGIVTVVPWSNARQASDRIHAQLAAGQVVDQVEVIRQETGAATVVTGSYYLVGNDIEFRVQIVDAGDGRLLSAPPPVAELRDSVHLAIRTLRDRTMGAVAILGDTRFEPIADMARHPPVFEAYQAFDRGLERYNSQDYAESLVEFHKAYALDTTFAVAQLYAAAAYWNRAEYVQVDSMLKIVRAQQGELSDYHRYRVDFFEAYLAGDGPRTLETIRLAAGEAPGSRAYYDLARTANRMGRPEEALAALETLDPDRGSMRGWSAYWNQLTFALHMVGEHQRELTAARGMQQRYPDRRIGLVLEVRALAAIGQVDRIDSVITASQSLPPTTYWSLGAAMAVAGEELQAHGWPGDGRRFLEQAEAWLQEQLELHPGERRHLYWLGSAYYDLQRWDEAADVFATLAREHGRFGYHGMAAVSAARTGDPDAARLLPDPGIRTTGSTLAYQARIAAIKGDIEQAAALFADAVEQGIDDLAWLHASAYHDLALLETVQGFLPQSLRVK